MHFENVRPEASRAERDGGPDDDGALLADVDGCLLADVDGGLLADVDGGLLAEPPHAAIATEPMIAAKTVRVATDHRSRRHRSAVTAAPRLGAGNREQCFPITP
jgi:hypothetical protein